MERQGDGINWGELFTTAEPMATPEMPQVELDLGYLLKQSGEYELALAREAQLKQQVAHLEFGIERESAYVIQRGYNNGEIEGKNASARERAEAIYLDSQETLRDLRMELRDDLDRLAQLSAYRQALEMRLKLLKAWLYSRANERA